MKKLLILAMIVVGSLVANSAHSQTHVSVSLEQHYPGHAYYSYHKWHGHYRDHAYYEHYHARFEREHQEYFHGREFDHDRYEREHHGR
jgi:hypothetical protein